MSICHELMSYLVISYIISLHKRLAKKKIIVKERKLNTQM